MLPTRKGFLKLHVFGSKAVDPVQQTYCLVRNKTFKLYNDGRDMLSLKGVIDFDVVKCTISIVDDTPEYSDRQPTKFKIEEVSSKTVFIFEATMESNLKKWVNAITKNHRAGEATKNPKFV